MDGFVRKYGPDGSVAWTRQFGSLKRDEVSGIGVDGAGAAYVVGTTEGALPGQASAGGRDAFVRRYGPAGAIIWTRQFGTALLDEATSVAVDGLGNVSVNRPDGGDPAPQTKRGGQGRVHPPLLPDRLGRLDPAVRDATERLGGCRGHRSPGQGDRRGRHVRRVRRRDVGGRDGCRTSEPTRPLASTPWTRQFGTSGDDECDAVATNAAGDIVVAGTTWGAFAGWTNKGGLDAFLRKY